MVDIPRADMPVVRTDPWPRYKLLVVACGRSGTHYAAHFYQEIGLDIGHERLTGWDGCAGWTGLFTLNHDAYQQVWHQVREPLGVIASTAEWNHWGTGGFMPLPGGSDPILRGLYYWVHWNRLCEEAASWTYRVEDLRPGTDTYRGIRNALDIPADAPDPDIPSDMSSRPHEDLTWADLVNADEGLALQAATMAQRYGYGDIE